MKNDDCHIPLLESVFEAFPNIPINVDIKTNSDVLIDKVSSIVVSFYFFNSFFSGTLINLNFFWYMLMYSKILVSWLNDLFKLGRTLIKMKMFICHESGTKK